MSSFPAATFTQFDPATQPRHAMPSGWGSPLYVIHKDITKTMENPSSINELIDGSETEAQYSVLLNVPPGSRGFIPFWIMTGTVSATTAYMTEARITVTLASANPLRYYFIGQTPAVQSTYAYGPSEAGLTGAFDVGTYGYWHPLAAIRLTSSSGGTANFFMYPNADNSSAVPAAFSLPTANSTGLSRTYVASALLNRSTNSPGFETLVASAQYPNATTNNFTSDSQPYIPLCGVTKLTCMATAGPTAPTITTTYSMGSGTFTVQSQALGVRFVS